MNANYKQVPTRFGPETRFEVRPAPVVPFRATQEFGLERLKNQFQFFGNDMVRTGAIGEWAAPFALPTNPNGYAVWFEAQRLVAKAGGRSVEGRGRRPAQAHGRHACEAGDGHARQARPKLPRDHVERAPWGPQSFGRPTRAGHSSCLRLISM